MIKVKAFVVNPFQQNTYLVYDESKECVIIDCGCYFEKDKEELKSFISENNLTPKRSISTHLHLDHAFGNRFDNEYGLKPEANEADEFLIAQMETQASMFGIELKESPMPLGGYLNEGETIKFGNSELEIIHVPGHSPGSLVFYDKIGNFLFVGDVLFQGSIGRTDLPKGDHHALIQNIKSKLMVLPAETIVYSGHGGSTTIAYEKANNPYLT